MCQAHLLVTGRNVSLTSRMRFDLSQKPILRNGWQLAVPYLLQTMRCSQYSGCQNNVPLRGDDN
jgi:hypothetical protein